VGGFTAAHNSVRTALNLPDLAWNDGLAAYAYVWATELVNKNGCTMEHRPQDASSPCDAQHGENLAWNSGYAENAANVTKRWADEVVDYDYENNSCTPGEQCGHYTQIVWRDSTEVGCAMLPCGGNTGMGNAGMGNAEMWVCNYAPPGNWVGEKPY
jgi:uncharacterized protein YkwD